MIDPTTSSANSDQGNQFLQRAFALNDTLAARDLYNDWAPSYDSWLSGLHYMSPQRAVDAALSQLPLDSTQTLKVLDAGCGTGLVGACLANAAHSRVKRKTEIDGVDLSQGMLDVAREKAVYKALEVVDLSQTLKIADATYDVVLCVGTLTKGHVGPKVFSEFVRVTKKGGCIVATVHNEVWLSGGYEEEVKRLEEQGSVDVLGTDEFGITEDKSTVGRLVILKSL